MSDADAHRFSTNLYYHGTNGTWWGQTQWSLASDERDVNHWDLTTGYPPVDPYRYGNMSDLIYYPGHGYPNGVQFWNPVTGSRELDKGKPPGTPPFMPDNLGTKELLFIGGEAARWEIGMDWAGTNRTNSRWDDDPEWVFMASCSQLDSTNYSRRNYARTMLGDPRRLHAIWSYRAGAPDDDVDVNVVDDYFYYAGWGRSNRYAWLNANDKNRNYNAAGLVHRSAEYEGLPPVAPLDPDSPVGSTPDIVYHYMWGNSSQPVAVNNSPAKAVLAWLAKLIRGEEAHAASKPIVFVGRDTVYRLETALPEIRDVPPVITHPTVQDWLAEDAMSVLGPRSTEVEPPLPDAKYRTRLGERGVVRVWDSGAMEFLSATEARQPVTLEESDVVKIAEEYVEQHGGMPADVGRTSTRAISAQRPSRSTSSRSPAKSAVWRSLAYALTASLSWWVPMEWSVIAGNGGRRSASIAIIPVLFASPPNKHSRCLLPKGITAGISRQSSRSRRSISSTTARLRSCCRRRCCPRGGFGSGMLMISS